MEEEKRKIQEEYKKVINEIMEDPGTSNEKFKALNVMLTDILKGSSEKERKELREILWRWKARTLFLDLLHELKDEEDKQN